MPDTVREFIGVYDADGTLLGEARYWIGARLGRTHCALCDITHGLFTERADWRSCREQLDVAFRTYHRDDAPEDVLAAGSPAPFVVARSDRGLVAVLGPAELDSCSGDVERFRRTLSRACADRNLDGI
ncbi:MAG: hypothetical protein KDB50_02550 [Mycobacterium sp.]|nr:hypothetical protein [Mycobacterium sp.]